MGEIFLPMLIQIQQDILHTQYFLTTDNIITTLFELVKDNQTKQKQIDKIQKQMLTNSQPSAVINHSCTNTTNDITKNKTRANDNKSEISFRIISSSEIDNILALQSKVIKKLKEEGNSDYLYERVSDDYLNVINNGGAIIGAYNSKNNLLGVILVNTSHTRDDFPYELPDNMKNVCEIKKAAVIEGLIVDLNSRGLNLGNRLVEEATKVAKIYLNRIFVFSVIDPKNIKSILSFSKNGFFIVNSYHNHSDNTDNYLMFSNLSNKIQSQDCCNLKNDDYIYHNVKIANDNGYIVKCEKPRDCISFEILKDCTSDFGENNILSIMCE